MSTHTEHEALDLTYLRPLLPDAPDQALDFIDRLEQMFRWSSACALASIMAACSTLDEAGLRVAACKLKRACLSLGASPMADMLVALETPAGPRDWDASRELLGELAGESLRVPLALSHLRRLVAAGAPAALAA